MSQRLILQLVKIDETGDSYYRMRWPGATIAAQRPDWRVVSLDAGATERFTLAREADLLIIYQSADLDLFPLITARRLCGKKTLVEYNDNFYAAQAWSPIAKEWSSPLLWQIYERFMLESDGVIVTGPGLADLFTRTVPAEKIHIIENHLAKSPTPFEELFPTTNTPLVIGWAGSLGHIADLLSVVPVLRNALNEFSALSFYVMGNEAIPDLLSLPSARFNYTPWGTMEQYMAFWRPVHIGVVPLIDTPYNRCRSDIKAVEIAASGALPILPDALPYRDFIARTGIASYHNLTELEALLTKYCSNPGTIREDALRCYRYVMQERCALDRMERVNLYEYFLGSAGATHPAPAGYFEERGTVSNSAHWTHHTTQAQALLQAGQKEAALQLLIREQQSTPSNPELLLAAFKCALATEAPQTAMLATEAERLFPRDLRFLLLSAKRVKNSEELRRYWRQIISRLNAMPSRASEFYASAVVPQLCLALRKDRSLLPFAEEATLIYPYAYELRFLVAQLLVEQGEDKKALAHYQVLEEAKRAQLIQQDFITSLERGYIAAWKEALTARQETD